MSKRRMFLLGASLILVLFISAYAINRTQARLREVPRNEDGNRILYLISDTTPPSEIAPRIQQELKTSRQESPAFLSSLESPDEIDALVIDGSIPLKDLDLKWIEYAYDSGVVIVALDKYGPEVATLVGDPTVDDDNFAGNPYSTNFYVVVYRVVRGNPEDVKQAIENAEAGMENPFEGISGEVSIGGGNATESLATDYGYEMLRRKVSTTIQTSRDYDNE